MKPEAAAPTPKPPPAEVVLTAGEGREHRIKLTKPASVARRFQIRYAVAENEACAVASALGHCSPKIMHAAPYKTSPIEHGERVLEFLLEQGCDYLQILNAGRQAWRFMTEDLPSAVNVRAKEDFFGQTPAESTSS